MLWYIIDGWNVIHQVSEIKDSSYPRQIFIQYIKRHGFTGSKNNRVTVVFDGFFDIEEIRQEREFSIVFSGESSADDVIIDKVRGAKNKKQIVVVSDDRAIASSVKALGANVLKVAEFIKMKKKKKIPSDERKSIGDVLEREITEELRNIWLGDGGDGI